MTVEELLSKMRAVFWVKATDFASKGFLEEAGKQGYIVVQSFEW
ncbi:MAG: hypothetical protein WKI49_05650 [Aquificaceae bacterium]